MRDRGPGRRRRERPVRHRGGREERAADDGDVRTPRKQGDGPRRFPEDDDVLRPGPHPERGKDRRVVEAASPGKVVVPGRDEDGTRRERGERLEKAVYRRRRRALGVPEVARHEQGVRAGFARRPDGALGRAVDLVAALGAELCGPGQPAPGQRRADVPVRRLQDHDRGCGRIRPPPPRGAGRAVRRRVLSGSRRPRRRP